MSDILARLIVLPTPHTLKRLIDVFSAPPLKLDPFELIHVTVARAYSPEAIQALTKVEDATKFQHYDFKFTSVDYLYDEHMGVSKLIGEIECAELQRLKAQLDPQGPDLGIQFVHNAPPIARSTRGFVSSVADTLVFKETQSFQLQLPSVLSEKDYLRLYKSHYVGFDTSTLREQR